MRDLRVELTALDGSNPLGFLAALGLLEVGERVVGPREWRLSWTSDVVTVPMLHGASDRSEIVEAIEADRKAWIGATALEWHAINDVKFSPDDCREYLRSCAVAPDGGRSAGLASALVAEGARDRGGATKPSDLHFTAGQQRLVDMMRAIRDGVTADHFEEALWDGWKYQSELPSLKWDVTDDRLYALSASNPATEKKLTVPGAEWLAVNGLAAFPVFARSDGRLLTTGCEGRWKSGGTFRWPIWDVPMTCRGARALVRSAHESKSRTLPGWGVFRLLRCSIRRSDQGGYGSFSPPTVVWERQE